MSNQQPRVSIGIPIYNGDNFIAEALDSMLAQTFEDFEIIISDNASTDKTEEICRTYAAKDQRIRYYRNEQNIGAAPNYDRVFELSRGEYFKWAAHDDVLSPDYLERCVKVLDNDPSVVMCYPKSVLIDINSEEIPFDATKDCFVTRAGDTIRKLDRPRNFSSSKPHERYEEVLFATRWCFEIFGVVRADALKKSSKNAPYYGGDKALIAEFSIMGRFQEIPEVICYFRRHSKQSGALESSKARANWNSPGTNYGPAISRLLCAKGYLHAIFITPLSWNERILCLSVFGRWLVKLDNWQRLMSEVYHENLSFLLNSTKLRWRS